MTEQEQKAFEQMRDALEEIICAHPITSTMRQVHAIVAGRNALAAAIAVQPQFMGFDVVVDPTMKPNEMKLVQPQAQVGALPIEGSEAADNAIHSMLCERQWPSSSMNAARAGWRAARLFTHPQATEPAWRPIESAPKDGTEIIGCWPSYIDSGSFARVTCKYVGWSWVTTDFMGTELAQPTYWSPLPAAPEAHHGK